jgi:hypothetical protein
VDGEYCLLVSWDSVTRKYCRCWWMVSCLGMIYYHSSLTLYGLLCPDSLYIFIQSFSGHVISFYFWTQNCIAHTVPVRREDLINHSLGALLIRVRVSGLDSGLQSEIQIGRYINARYNGKTVTKFPLKRSVPIPLRHLQYP